MGGRRRAGHAVRRKTGRRAAGLGAHHLFVLRRLRHITGRGPREQADDVHQLLGQGGGRRPFEAQGRRRRRRIRHALRRSIERPGLGVVRRRPGARLLADGRRRLRQPPRSRPRRSARRRSARRRSDRETRTLMSSAACVWADDFVSDRACRASAAATARAAATRRCRGSLVAPSIEYCSP